MYVTQADNYDCERMLFCGLYQVVLGEKCDPMEFDTDDLYAFRATERALHSESGELRNLAAHLQTQRHTELETITLKPAERLDRTWRLPTLQSLERTTAPAAPAPRGMEADLVLQERRGKMERFTPREILALSTLQRLYRKQFRRVLDVALFASSDSYGRHVLAEAMASENADLIAAASCFLDAQGRPHRHRRNT